MKKEVSEADITKIAKCFEKAEDEKFQIFALRTLRMKVRDLRDIKNDTEDLAERIKQCIFSWQGNGSENTREALHNQIKKTPQLAGIIKDASDWVSE